MDKLFELNKKLYSAHTGVGFGVIASSKQAVAPTVGGWVELDRTTLGSANATIDVTGLADKRYYMFLINDTRTAGATDGFLRLNSISTNTYAQRDSSNGGADSTSINRPGMGYNIDTGADQNFTVGYIANLSAKEKLAIYHRVNKGTTGAANAPNRREWVGKHAQTSNPVTAIGINSGGANTYSIGSEVVVLEWDPVDVHTNNFWEELASVDLSGGAADTISSGVFTAKKYLWIQFFLESSGTVQDGLRVGNTTVDTGSNYSYRSSFNGGADSTAVGQNDIGDFQNISNNAFFNMFIINNASNEKLIQYWVNTANAAGSGTVPTRGEIVGKWANTSNQINVVEMRNVAGGGDYGTKTIVKVWGSN